MNTSKYDSKTRHDIKREARTPGICLILAEGRGQRKALEAKLAERNDEIAELRKIVQGQIDRGAWNAAWEKLGFTKPTPKAEAEAEA